MRSCRIEQAIALFETGDNTLDSGSEIVHGNRIAAAPRRQQRCLVDEIGEIGAAEARRQRGDLLGLRHPAASLAFFRWTEQDLHPPDLVRPVDQDLAVEAPRPQQSGIQDLGAVGGGEEDEARARIESVELGQQLKRCRNPAMVDAPASSILSVEQPASAGRSSG